MRKKSKYAAKKKGLFDATEKSKTAQFANPRNSRPTKAEYNLARRIKDWEGIKATIQGKSGKYSFHKPGSLQR